MPRRAILAVGMEIPVAPAAPAPRDPPRMDWVVRELTVDSGQLLDVTCLGDTEPQFARGPTRVHLVVEADSLALQKWAARQHGFGLPSLFELDCEIGGHRVAGTLAIVSSRVTRVHELHMRWTLQLECRASGPLRVERVPPALPPLPAHRRGMAL